MTHSLLTARTFALTAACVAALAVVCPAEPTTDATPLPSLVERGRRTLALIDKTFTTRDRDAGLYYLEELKPDDPKSKPHVVYAWGVGLQFSALNAAAKIDPAKYRATLVRYARSVQAYWFVDKAGLGGFSAAVHPTSADRYYDDNAWICLDYCDAFEITNDKAMLEAAKRTMAFMLSGQDDKLGGGIYWHEQKKTSKNTCINAPAAVGALRLFKLTGDAAYLDTAKSLYAWTQKNLQDPADGLYFDNINLDGKVAKPKYSYNTALMIRAACLLHDQTHDAAYLKEAARLAKASEAKWFRPDGSADDVSYFGHLMLEALLDYGDRAKDTHWRDLAVRTCDYLWRTNRGPDGHFPEHWDARDKKRDRRNIMWDASNARLFFRVAEAVGER